MPDVFIWYETDEEMEPALLDWMGHVESEADVRGALYIRKEDGKTTFMEAYHHVTTATINRIERLAAQQKIFEDIREIKQEMKNKLSPSRNRTKNAVSPQLR